MNISKLAVDEARHESRPTEHISGAEAVIRCLLAEDVHTIFGYPGGAIMPVYDALYGYLDRLQHILVCHEQGAVHAAQGYARVSNEAGVCLATSGPGATNLITGIADAMLDSTPLVCITGQVGSALLGTDAFQEIDMIGISMPVTKWNYQVTRAEEIPFAMARAFYIARSGRPGPVLIDITKDAQFGMFDFAYTPCTRIRSYQPYPQLDPKKVDKAAALIASAKKPMVLAGQGVILSDAQEELIAFAEKSGIPVACTLLGLSAIPADHPLYVGYLGMHGNYGPNVKTNECDLLIAVGMRFDDRVTGDLSRYAKQAKVIHIEIDPAEIDKNVKADVPVISDAKAALFALTAKVHANAYPDWLAEFHACDAIEQQKVTKKDLTPDTPLVKMAEVIDLLSRRTEGSAVVVSDVGQHQMAVSRYYAFRSKRHNVTSGGLGTMGFALPAAMGAVLGQSEKPVVAVIGDGGFQMTIQELGTISRFQLDVKILILNNSFLGMVRQWQQLFFEKRYSFTELTNPDFGLIAQAYGISALKVTERSDLEKTMGDFLSRKGPVLLEVVVEKEENVFPMVATGASVSEIRLE